MKEIKLETGTLKVTRNANLLMTVSFGGYVLSNLNEYNSITTLALCSAVICLGRALFCQKDIHFLNKNQEKYPISELRNMTTELRDEYLKLNCNVSHISAIFTCFLAMDYIYRGFLTEMTIPTISLAATNLLTGLSYRKSGHLYNKIINKANEEKIKTLN